MHIIVYQEDLFTAVLTAKKNMGRRHDNINENIDYLTNQLGISTNLTRTLRERHDHRFLHLDRKRAEIESRTEENYRELAKKIMNVENKLNEIGRALAQEIRAVERASKSGPDRLEKKIKMLKDSQKSEIMELKHKIKDVKAGTPKSLKRKQAK